MGREVKHTEHALHRAVAAYLRDAIDEPWTTFPAGGGGLIRGAQLKDMGLEAGWPDIQILKDGIYHGIELKAPGNYPPAKQKAIHERIRAAGGRVAVCRSVDEVEGTLAGWGFSLKAHTGPK